MNKYLYFALGAVCGGVATYFAVRDHFRMQAQQEIDDVRNYYQSKETEQQKPAKDVCDKIFQSQPDKNCFSSITSTNSAADIQENEEITMNYKSNTNASSTEAIRPSSLEEYIERNGYDKIILYYYSIDTSLATEDGVELDIETTVGNDAIMALSSLTDGESVYARNDILGEDYQIYLREASYSEEVLGV
jgi:hypothetical protein